MIKERNRDDGLEDLQQHMANCPRGRLCMERMKRRVTRSRAQRTWIWTAVTGAAVLLVAASLWPRVDQSQASTHIDRAAWARKLIPPDGPAILSPADAERLHSLLKDESSYVRRAALVALTMRGREVSPATLRWMLRDAPETIDDVTEVADSGDGATALAYAETRRRTTRAIADAAWVYAGKNHTFPYPDMLYFLSEQSDEVTRTRARRALSDAGLIPRDGDTRR